MKTKKQKGTGLEEYFCSLLKDRFPYARPSKGSGNSTEIGDITGVPALLVECKHRETENITIKQKVWEKLVNELPINSNRIPMYVLRNKNKKVWVALNLEDFINIFKQSVGL